MSFHIRISATSNRQILNPDERRLEVEFGCAVGREMLRNLTVTLWMHVPHPRDLLSFSPSQCRDVLHSSFVFAPKFILPFKMCEFSGRFGTRGKVTVETSRDVTTGLPLRLRLTLCSLLSALNRDQSPNIVFGRRSHLWSTHALLYLT